MLQERYAVEQKPAIWLQSLYWSGISAPQRQVKTRNKSSTTSLALILLMVGCAQAVNTTFDDILNNLGTDLAPLLALFGEQVTNQYLSESLSLFDNFIFALAPLGIITAMVSAIRVSGSSKLRTLIGRAKESRGIVEAGSCHPHHQTFVSCEMVKASLEFLDHRFFFSSFMCQAMHKQISPNPKSIHLLKPLRERCILVNWIQIRRVHDPSNLILLTFPLMPGSTSARPRKHCPTSSKG